MTTIFLIGPRGSGKTTVGKLLAKHLGLPFLDTDRMACERAGCSIAELVEKEGWPAFRTLEAACLADAARMAPDEAAEAAPAAQGKYAEATGAERAGDLAAAGGGVLSKGVVIATGGGAVLAPENRERMRSTGRVIYLQVPLEILAQRLERNLSAGNRPSLTGMDPVEELAAIVAEREPLYLATAHHIVAADLPLKQIVQELAGILADGR